MKKIAYLLTVFLPWTLRRWLLCRVFGYEIHSTCKIGLSWIQPTKLKMAPYSRIGHFTICKGLELVQIDTYGTIGNGNWITGYPLSQTRHFSHLTNRQPILVLGEHAAITNRHFIDCTEAVRIGRFATFAGFSSQILTHSIDLEQCRQSAAPVTVGEYCFVGTNVVLLGGSALPSYSVLGAKSLLNKAYSEPHILYGGVPARRLRELDPELAYFKRSTGFVA